MSPPDEARTERPPHGPARIAALERDYERLRRSQRRLRIAVGVLTLAAAMLILAAATDAPPDELELRELRIVQEDGTPRLVLTSQVPRSIHFYGRRLIRNSPDASGIVFHDEDGMEQGAVGVLDRGGLVMGMDSKTGQNGSLTVAPDGRAASFSLWTNRGERHRLQLSVHTERGPVLEMTRARERVLRLPRPDTAGTAAEDTDE